MAASKTHARKRGARYNRPLLTAVAAFGDLNNDGRIDMIVSAIGEPAKVLHNVGSPEIIGFDSLQGTKSNRDGIGAKIKSLRNLDKFSTTTSLRQLDMQAPRINASIWIGCGPSYSRDRDSVAIWTNTDSERYRYQPDPLAKETVIFWERQQ